VTVVMSGIIGVSLLPRPDALAVTVGGMGSEWAAAVIMGVNDDLIQKGYVPISSGQSQRWGKMTLSLWQQAKCVKMSVLNETTVQMNTLDMRPIFSGATNNQNKDYDIQEWVDKKGTRECLFLGYANGTLPEGDVNLYEYEYIDVFKNGTYRLRNILHGDFSVLRPSPSR
jgi:hypothetical protein